MQRHVALALAAVAVAFTLAAPADAGAPGAQRFDGVIVTSGASGDRVVLTSTVRAKGVFSGVGDVVEVDDLPGDPDNVDRDDLVFAAGTMHIVSTALSVEFSLDPRSCGFTATVEQTGAVVGGTGQFVNAAGTYSSTVSARGLLERNADGSCSFDRAPLHEVDTLAASGTLSL